MMRPPINAPVLVVVDMIDYRRERDGSGIADTLIRIAVGLEDIDDIKADLSAL